jgi:gluconate 5-dehydrogenase
MITPLPLDKLMRLDGRNALVVGGSGEIGSTIAHTLASLGATVGLAARKRDPCAAIAAELEADYGRSAAAIEADASSAAGVAALVGAFNSQVGPLDILVFNAAAYASGEVWEIPPERWRRVFAVNLDGPFFAVQSGFEGLRERRGSVIIVSSVGGVRSFRRATATIVPYTTSKAAVMHLTRDLAAQLGDFGIRVNSLAPGQIDSGMTETLSSEQRQEMLERIPLGRLGDPGDLAGATAFLASDLSLYVTGQTLFVDGGLTLI